MPAQHQALDVGGQATPQTFKKLNDEQCIIFYSNFNGNIFLIAGFIMLKFPGKKINSSYGYRTFRSMENQQTWDFAQLYSGKESIKTGTILALCSIIGIWYNPDKGITIILGLILILGPAIILITNVERAIKRKFRNEHEQKPN